MKTVKLSAIAMASIIFVSCGTTKQSQQTQYPNYGGYQPQQPQGYYQQPAQGYYQQPPQGYYQQPQQGMYQGQVSQYQQQYRPEMTEEEFIRQQKEKDRNENPCKYLAENAPYNEYRSYGEGIGFDSSSARLEAEIAAETELVRRLYEDVNAVLNSTSKNIVTDPKSPADGGRVTNLDYKSISGGKISGWRVLLSKEERTPRGVVCRVCLTMSFDNAMQSLTDMIQKKYRIDDITAFRNEAEKIREGHRLQNTGTNQQLQQQQADFNMQSQIKDQEFQREQQRAQQQQQFELQQQQQQYNYQLQQQQQNNNYQLQQQQNNYQQQQNYNNQPQQNNNYQLLQQNNYQ